MYQVTHISFRFGMNFQIKSATESSSDTHLVFFLHISLHAVRKKTAQVIYSSTVASSEVQEQVEVERTTCRRDRVPAEMCSLKIFLEWKIFQLLVS